MGVTEDSEVCGPTTCGGVYEINSFTACSGEPTFTEGVQISAVDQADIDADLEASGYASAAAAASTLVSETYMPLVTSSYNLILQYWSSISTKAGEVEGFFSTQ